MAGHTYQEIADECEYAGPSGAYQAVMKALAATLSEPGEQVRTLETARLDQLTALWKQATSDPPDYDALDRVIKIMERRAKLLGLDAPTKQVIAGETKTYDVVNSPEKL